MKEFLARKDIVISVKRYGIDALGAMAQGLFCTLLIGTIINTLGTQLNIEVLTRTVVTINEIPYTIGGLASAGGTDLLAKLIITKLKALSLGSILMLLDGSIVVMAMVVYRNVGAGIYALLAIAVSAVVTDKLNSGFNKADMFFIFINENLDKISNAILYDMGRGTTLIEGIGMFSGDQKKILMTVVKPNEMPKLKSIVHKYDPTAFIILTTAFEIIGEGFEHLDLTNTISDE